MGSLRQLPVIILKTEIWSILNIFEISKQYKQHLYLPDFQKTELYTSALAHSDIIKSSFPNQVHDQ